MVSSHSTKWKIFPRFRPFPRPTFTSSTLHREWPLDGKPPKENPVESIRPSKRRPFFRWARSRPLTRLAVPLSLLFALPLYAQSTGSDPWDNAVNVLKTAFTGMIATGLSLVVASVVGGLMFAYGEGQSKKTIARM
jgi:type IV secretion system protein TrbC